jgi:hypothetical protein
VTTSPAGLSDLFTDADIRIEMPLDLSTFTVEEVADGVSLRQTRQDRAFVQSIAFDGLSVTNGNLSLSISGGADLAVDFELIYREENDVLKEFGCKGVSSISTNLTAAMAVDATALSGDKQYLHLASPPIPIPVGPVAIPVRFDLTAKAGFSVTAKGQLELQCRLGATAVAGVKGVRTTEDEPFAVVPINSFDVTGDMSLIKNTCISASAGVTPVALELGMFICTPLNVVEVGPSLKCKALSFAVDVAHQPAEHTTTLIASRVFGFSAAAKIRVLGSEIAEIEKTLSDEKFPFLEIPLGDGDAQVEVRNIPGNARGIKYLVRELVDTGLAGEPVPGATLATEVLSRPGDEATSTATIEDLPPIRVRVVATAHEAIDGSGEVLAQGLTTLEIKDGEVTTGSIEFGCQVPVVQAVTPATAGVGEIARFRVEATNDPTLFEWDFGGGGIPDQSSEVEPEITFAEQGHFVGTVRVGNECGLSEFFAFTYSVGCALTILSVSPTQGLTRSQVQFGASIAGTPGSFSWDFGGGAVPNSSTEPSPIVTLGEPGSYTLHLEVTDECGQAHAATFDYTVTRSGGFGYRGTYRAQDPSDFVSCSGEGFARIVSHDGPQDVLSIRIFDCRVLAYEFTIDDVPGGGGTVTQSGFGPIGTISPTHLSVTVNRPGFFFEFEGDIQ